MIAGAILEKTLGGIEGVAQRDVDIHLFLGELRDIIPKSLSTRVVLEVNKDLIHQDERAISAHLTPNVFVDPV